jgi:hypothetical protein
MTYLGSVHWKKRVCGSCFVEPSRGKSTDGTWVVVELNKEETRCRGISPFEHDARC